MPSVFSALFALSKYHSSPRAENYTAGTLAASDCSNHSPELQYYVTIAIKNRFV